MRNQAPMDSGKSKIVVDEPSRVNKQKTSLVDEYIQKIHNILHPKFEHSYAQMTRSTYKRLHLQELMHLHAFLENGMLLQNVQGQRFKCPVTNSLSQAICRYDYKLAMVKYISNFGFTFHNNPCSYSPAILESVANYCEYISTKGSGDI